MKRIWWIAWREFSATVTTKGFILGILVTPIIIAVMVVVMPILMDETPPRVEGELTVLDSTGVIVDDIAAWLAPEAVARRAGELAEAIDEAMPDAVRVLGDQVGQGDMADQALEAILAGVPDIEVVPLPVDTDLEAEKELLLLGSASDGGLLALAVIHHDAVERDSVEGPFGDYDLFVREKLDDRIEDEIQGALRDAIISGRFRFSGLDRDEIEALTTVRRVRSTTVTKEGEQETNEVINMLLPGAFMILLLMAVMTGGQQLLLTTVEEKRSRVVEVLLSAVSPMQLMAGKIVGQMCVGFVMLGVYGAMGLVALISFAMLGFVDLSLIFYLIIFYLIAYFTLGSAMAAIGSAVNEITEAQSLMMPVMMTMMIPWLLWMPITRDPNGIFSVVTSFVPPINTFVMMLRMSSITPPPLWQVWLSILVGIAGAYGALWAAAKIFRVGLLMYGKPPNLPTLLRWIRRA
jgi:ABC-2 type transport system permease protein